MGDEKLLTTISCDFLQEERMIDKLSKSDPEFLYRYYGELKTGFSKERIFTHNEVYFSNLKGLNDPFDSVGYRIAAESINEEKFIAHMLKDPTDRFPGLSREAKRRGFAKIYKERIAKDPKAFFAGFEGGLKKLTKGIMGVLCLSGKPANILMWSYYSSGHRGFCLEFQADKHTPFFAQAQPIKYRKEYPILDFFQSTDGEKMQKILLTKSIQWKHEDEWRILGKEYKPGPHHFPPEFLKGVIFGCAMEDKDKHTIMEWVGQGQTKPKFYQAKTKKDEYGLKIVPYSKKYGR